ncbi:M15 family metallopeptidase [Solirubrobacter phytolaccae]|uniref:D-alanyl-D-alanine dipeptidase n=1 Tax=Solirubrobacter phytolaccae TaxID=1404360 RepID=A0A9X3NBN5_9ACTN|nr:M15 family metallopeptidase [Solirubrobacter phytolaccae]MDA0183413.1 M15 family metallopeptidase [Solirubrobacter phytolaccae]
MTRRLLLAAAVALLVVAAPAAGQTPTPTAPAGAFVDLHDVAPTIVVEMRYRTTHNFLGRRVPGYRENTCILTRQAAEALARVQERVSKSRLTLKVYDCYRPQRSVDAFVAWAKDLDDTRMKAEFYPRVRKNRLFKDGYIAAQSGHSRGSTVDLTLVRTPPRKQEQYTRGERLRDCTAKAGVRFGDNSLDMGTGYDCFDPLSHTYNARVGDEQHQNRLLLREPMYDAGFKGLKEEWWHFTLRDEPFPETFFDFPVERAALSR